LSQAVAELVLWWVLIGASFPFSYYTFRAGATNMRGAYRRIKLCSTFLVGSFISYVMWLLVFRPGSSLVEFSPFLGFLLAVVFPWLLGLRRRS